MVPPTQRDQNHRVLKNHRFRQHRCLAAKQPWSPQDVFNRYRKSFYEGDATYTWKADERTTWTTTIGGVDFTNIPMVNMTPADFTKDHPNLPATATDSLFGPRFRIRAFSRCGWAG